MEYLLMSAKEKPLYITRALVTFSGQLQSPYCYRWLSLRHLLLQWYCYLVLQALHSDSDVLEAPHSDLAWYLQTYKSL